MNKYFSSEYAKEAFKLFDSTHIITLTILVAVNILLFLLLKRRGGKKAKKHFRYILAAFIAFADILFYVFSYISGNLSVRHALPLHICDLAVILSVIMLLTGNRFVYEITYFWGLAGSLQAIITPDLAPYNFPHYIFFSFFILHSVVITSVLYMTLIEGYRPAFISILKTLAFTNLYAAAIAVVNLLLDSNYLFLCRKPHNPTIIDYLGPWPWYLLSLELVAIISFLICYSPFFIKDFFPLQYTRSKNRSL